MQNEKNGANDHNKVEKKITDSLTLHIELNLQALCSYLGCSLPYVSLRTVLSTSLPRCVRHVFVMHARKKRHADQK